MTKSSDCKSYLVKGHASRPYKSTDIADAAKWRPFLAFLFSVNIFLEVYAVCLCFITIQKQTDA